MTKPILLGNRIQVLLPGGQIFYWNGSGYSAEIERAVAYRSTFAAVEQIEACQTAWRGETQPNWTVARADLVLVFMQILHALRSRPLSFLASLLPSASGSKTVPVAGRPLQTAPDGKDERLVA